MKPLTKKSPTLDSLLKGYSYINSNIIEANFPRPEKIETEGWKLIKMEKIATSEEVLAEIKNQGCRPANLWELALWKKNNEKSIERPSWTVAFGQIWTDADGHHRVPHVHCDSDGDFEFNLGYFEDVWFDGDAFLCFCDQNVEPKTLKSSDTLVLENRVKALEEWKEKVLEAFR